ncbi:hypothetical protein DXG01_008486 [Tephrocybe rancida]|nr:hypothetical protein DXG01_008486 [Tephrocybe rancida]
MVIGRNHFFRDDKACVIGLKAYASIPLLSYDLYINVFLTAMFLFPLFRPQVVSPSVKRVAVRTLLASTVALTTSTVSFHSPVDSEQSSQTFLKVNISVLASMKGQQLGWVCLGSCTADVVVNALAIFWVTQNADNRSVHSSSDGPSKALQDRVQRRTAGFTPDAKIAFKGRLPIAHPRSFDGSAPVTSGEQMLRELCDIESGRKRTPNTYKALKSFSDSIFSPSRDRQPTTRSHGELHITVTTEFELEETKNGLKSMQESEARVVSIDH